MICCISSEITDQTAQVGYALCESEFSTLNHYLIILRVKLVTVVSISSHEDIDGECSIIQKLGII